MSYDLFFRPRAGRPMPTRELTAWFKSRPHYAVKNGQAVYENEDTGVYFVFDFPEATTGEEVPSLAFNLNYARPACFALEAGPELDAIVGRFDFDVEDPQIDGMDEGPYMTEGFMRGWTAGNGFAVRTYQTDANARAELLTLPAATILRVWRWNLARKDLQARLGETVFVPKISYVVSTDRVQPAAVWADGIPITLPPVELLLLARDRLAPRRFLRRVSDICVCTYEDAAPLLRRFGTPSDDQAYVRLNYLDAPPEVTAFFRERTAHAALTMTSFDRVLEAELVAPPSPAG